MKDKACINHKINHLKEELETAVVRYKYNFKHPKVISLSQRLDNLIIELMKKA